MPVCMNIYTYMYVCIDWNDCDRREIVQGESVRGESVRVESVEGGNCPFPKEHTIGLQHTIGLGQYTVAVNWVSWKQN